MKYFKYINIGKPENPGNYYFIKPFEIVSTYTAFIDTWKIANKVCKEIDDVSDTSLLQSYSDLAKFGYVSYSKWNSKESFIKVNNENPVLGYHNTLNGSDARSATHYLYKLISGAEFFRSNNQCKTFEVIFLETEIADENDAKEYWDSICRKEKYNGLTSGLYKSIYKKSKYRFIGFMQNQNSLSMPETSLSKLHLETKNGFKVHSLFLKTILKY